MLGPDGSEASKSKSWQRRYEAFLAISLDDPRHSLQDIGDRRR